MTVFEQVRITTGLLSGSLAGNWIGNQSIVRMVPSQTFFFKDTVTSNLGKVASHCPQLHSKLTARTLKKNVPG